MSRLLKMGRLNGKSRKTVINTPKHDGYQLRMWSVSLGVPYPQCRAIQDVFREVKCNRRTTFQEATKSNTVKMKIYKYQGWGNRIKGFEKLDGLVLPK